MDKITEQQDIRQEGEDLRGIILERLEQECDSYISNLRFDRNLEVLEHLVKMNIEQYSLAEWGYSLSYIFNENLCFSNCEEVSSFFQNKS